ncbi:Uncharacterized protein OS=Anabaena cylindrica (strain ATCC 27899 / PCC 7122) GN=Anacy_4468 PE=4 SV=1 [Gemmata massiliana]|uniref:Uncharacterized protein n=1 Tax=Gemmata massiliana TaxID=1210884 RepID=A0A6P2DE38_9BACT|nr:HEPN domain-containing protein [Gemmata massiliana]VTS00456.1 Uncharacterized protein OS=Anabaena cylindrica (strain ATCC 27899 / PCC 7122) GN=Anacy_4468 PE=4 SV=1 [Gemmata massiliana]
MHEEPKRLLAQALRDTSTLLVEALPHFMRTVEVPRPAEGGGLTIVEERQPNFKRAMIAITLKQMDVGAAFVESFVKHHPEFSGMVFVSTGSGLDLKTFLVGAVVDYLWKKHRAIPFQEPQIFGAISQLEKLLDERMATLSFHAELMNFTMDGDLLELPLGCRIRRLSPDELIKIVPNPETAFSEIVRSHDEFCIEGDLTATITTDDKAFGSKDRVSAAEMVLKIVAGIRAFKSGGIHTKEFLLRPKGFFPFSTGTMTFGHTWPHLEKTEIKKEDEAPLVEHLKQYVELKEKSMLMACARLCEAQVRTSPLDRVLDACIALELLLLGGMPKDDRKGELKYRFSMNYASLHTGAAQRHAAYQEARHIYDLRSTIAHGSTPDEPIRLGADKVGLIEAANRTIEVLRFVIKHFLPQVQDTPYKKPEFWDAAHFGLPYPPPKK